MMRQGFIALTVVGVLLLASCSSQDFGSSVGLLTDIADSGDPYVEEDGEAAAMARQARLSAALTAWESQRTQSAEDYPVGPNDVLQISVISLEEPGKTAVLKRTVGEDNTVSLPLVEAIKVGGLSTRQIEARIAAAYDGKYLKNPEVAVLIEDYRSAPVVVTGAVAEPGVFYLKRTDTTVLEMLSEANGLSEVAGNVLYVVRNAAKDAGEEDAEQTAGAAEIIEVDLHRLLDDGDVRLNLVLNGGDIVSVPPQKKQFVYVLGYVQRPGAFEITDSGGIRALQAVAKAGGLAPSARAQNSFLISERPEGRRIVPVDLTKIARGVRPPLQMKSGDTLVVGSGMLAKLSEFIKPSIGASASYSPVP
jgi:polysaccharide export outer membrane protein